MTNHTRSIICAGLFFPATILATVLTGAYFKATNPSNVDISLGLAYLGQMMLVGAVVGLGLLVLGFIFAFKASKQEGSRAARLPLALLSINVLATIMIVGINTYTDKVENNYLIDHGRATLQQNFDALKQNQQ